MSNAQRVAEWLEARDEVDSVIYAGLPSSPWYERAAQVRPDAVRVRCSSFEIKGGVEAGRRFVDALELHSHVANIGDVRSLVIHPASTTHSQLDARGAARHRRHAGPGPALGRPGRHRRPEQTSDLIAIEHLTYGSGYDIGESCVDLIQLGTRKLMSLSATMPYGGIYLSVNCRLNNNQIVTTEALSVKIPACGIYATLVQNSRCLGTNAHIKAATHCLALSYPCCRHRLQGLVSWIEVAGDNAAFLKEPDGRRFIFFQQMNFFKLDFGLRLDFHFVSRAGHGGNLAFTLWISWIDAFQWKKLIEIRLIRFTVLLKITPLPRDVCAGVEDDYALIHDMARRVLHNHPHNAADELHGGGQVTEDAKHRGDCQKKDDRSPLLTCAPAQ